MSAYKGISLIQINSIFIYISLIIGIAALITVIFLNYMISKILFRPYYVEKNNFYSEINKSNLSLMIYPMFQILIVLENFVEFKIILITKLIIRAFFIWNFSLRLYNIHRKTDNLELFISSFCYFSCLFEFIFIKVFFAVSDYSLFFSDPKKISRLYENDIFYAKLFIQITLAIIICIVRKITDERFLLNYFDNIFDKSFFTFYLNNFELLWQFKNDNLNTEFIMELSKSIHNHLEICNNVDCGCKYYRNLYYDSSSKYKAKKVKNQKHLIINCLIKKKLTISKVMVI